MKFRINLQLIIILTIGILATALMAVAVFFDAFDTDFAVLKEIFPRLIVYSAIILAVLTGIGCLFTDMIVRPIENLSESLAGDNVDIPGSLDAMAEKPEYRELSTLMKTIKKQHKNVVDNADMRQQFTANVTHELKTPLTAITGYSELIENGMATGDDIRRFAGEIRRNSLRLLTLINDTIRLSELDMVDDDEEWQLVDLFDVADTCVSMLQFNAESHFVELELRGNHALIYANKGMIEELVYNLCDNAIRYNINEGTVLVSVRDDNNSVILSVKDTGIGIPKEYQSRVFERFYRVDKSRSKEKGGTGLGLAIVKHIVARHNAEIYVASEEEKGTEIIVIFKKTDLPLPLTK